MSAVAVVGFSGTGKSTSMKTLNPKETCIINVAGKDLPFKGWAKLYTGHPKDGGNYLETSDADQIVKCIEYVSSNRPDIKHIIIDDAQYIMAFEYLRRAKENGYQKFADIGVNMGKIVAAAKNSRKDLTIFFMWHPEPTQDSYKMKTIGKMVDDYLTLEGLFTVVLYTDVSKDTNNTMKYSFVTNNDGKVPAKSPQEMFEHLTIPNDLSYVVDKIEKYRN